MIQTIIEQRGMQPECIQHTSKEMIPPKHRIASKNELADDILKMMHEKRKKKQDQEEHMRLHKETVNKSKESKEIWHNQQSLGRK